MSASTVVSANDTTPSSSAAPFPSTGGTSYPTTGATGASAYGQWPDYNAYAAYYQPHAGYGQYPGNAATAPGAVPPPSSAYPGYPPAGYQNYPNPAVGSAPTPVPPPPPSSSAGSANNSESAATASSVDSPNKSSTHDVHGVPMPHNPNAPYYPAAPPFAHNSQNLYNYGQMPPHSQAPPPPPGAYPGHPPNPYPNPYPNAPPAYPPQAPNSGYYNNRPNRNFYDRNFRPHFNQPPAWTNDAGTVRVEGFPTDITLDELRSTFNVGALKKDPYTGYDRICVSPDRQCAFLAFEDPSVAEAAVVMLNESSIRGQKIAVQIYDGNYQNQGFKRRHNDDHNGPYNHNGTHHHGGGGFNKRPRFDHPGGGNYRDNRDRGPNWPCVACGASNHAHRWDCFKCRAPKPGNEKAGNDNDGNFPSTHMRTAEDWICSSCNNHNFAKRVVCNRCKGPKPSNPTLAPMSATGANNTPLGKPGSGGSHHNFAPPNQQNGGGGSNGWNCDKCSTNNPITKLLCSQCSQPKPGIPQKTIDVMLKLNAIGNRKPTEGGNQATANGGGSPGFSNSTGQNGSSSSSSRWGSN